MARIAGHRGDAPLQLMSEATEAATAGPREAPTSLNPIRAKFAEFVFRNCLENSWRSLDDEFFGGAKQR
jgi:hypothetical protein